MPTATHPIAAPPQRRWYQYNLRTLFIVVTVVCGLLAWLVIPIERQRAAILSFRRLGADVIYSPIPDDESWLRRTLRTALPCDYFDSIDHFNIQSCPTFSDSDLEWIQPLTRLEVLVVYDAPVTDAGLKHLSGLTRLRTLVLDKTQVTDAGLVHLQGLTQLRYLSLNKTPIRDNGLAYLHGLKGLRELDLRNTQVTAAGIEELTLALPNCEIHHW